MYTNEYMYDLGFVSLQSGKISTTRINEIDLDNKTQVINHIFLKLPILIYSYTAIYYLLTCFFYFKLCHDIIIFYVLLIILSFGDLLI